MKTLILTLLLASCARTQAKAPVEPRLGELRLKVDSYLELKELDEDGWIMPGDCDGLLHNSLAFVSGLVSYDDLKKAEREPGRWFRTPSGDCLDSGRSKSSISRDMLLGVLLAATVKGDKQTIQDMIAYADDNDRFMGENDGSFDGKWRTYVTPSFYGTMVACKQYLESNTLVQNKLIQEVDYTDHLAAIHFFLSSIINGGATYGGIEYMKWLSEKDPENALYHALYAKYSDDLEGRQARATDILLREDLFPVDRLPKPSDRCISYLWMHGEKDKDWNPCDGEENHPGHDLTFAATVVFYSSF